MRESSTQGNLFADVEQLREAIMIGAAEVLQLRSTARLPVNKNNKRRMLRLAAAKEKLLEFAQLNLNGMRI